MKTKSANDTEIAALFAQKDSGPIAVINLLKFHDKARYPEDAEESQQQLTGREAYQIYAEAFMKLMAEHGAKSIFLGETERYIIGEGNWDAGWINYFPSRDAFKLITSGPGYQKIFHHRLAGLDYQEAIVTKPSIPENL